MHRRVESDRRPYHAFAFLLAVAVMAASCGGERPSISESKASELLSMLRARPASPLGVGLAERFVSDHGTLHPTFVASPDKSTALVSLPTRASAAVHIEDATTGAGIDVKLLDARGSVGRPVEGTVVYSGAHASGATLIHRPVPEGDEDYLVFDQKPLTALVEYDVVMGHAVAGLRLIENQLEMLDIGGAPRLRVAPPYLVDANGETVAATLAVEGCAVDTDPGAPWDRAVTPLGSATCRVRVSWNESAVSYPAVLDPRWVSTGNMTSVRQDFTATLLSTGKVLAVGGRTSGTSTTGLATAELFDRTTNTWAATASLTGGRYLHAAVQLGTTSSSTTSGKVLIAGGTNAGASLNTAQLYSASSGTWVAATNLNVARHSQTATLLSNGNVLLAAGLSGTTVLNSAAVYNPQSGSGSWTATGNMPQAVKFHTASLLQIAGNSTLNNKVIVVGGNSGSASVANVQLFDGTSTWSGLTALTSTREGHTATALANGNVLVTGGRSGSTTLNTTLLFNAASGSGSWASAGTMTAARQLHTATLLPSVIVKNGQVLVAGGSSGSASLGSAELWNGTSTWTATTTLPSAVQGQTATLLSNNMVLLAGGASGSTTVATSMVYDASFSLACTSNSQCTTGFCVNGACCDTACNGGCGACNLTGKVGTCSPMGSGTVCRAQNGACDVAETCNGSALTCPTDGFAPSTTVCRASTGSCDPAETCTGTSASCPANALAPAGTVCRAAAGGCDSAETCSGTSATCPADTLAPAGTVCRPAMGVCDVSESCSGTSATCPTDTFAAAGTVCSAASGNQSAELCTGASGVCAESGKAFDVLGFETPGDWSASNSAGAVVGQSAAHTQGLGSLEVTAQNYATFTSAPLTAIGSAGTLLLLDIMLPVESPPNPYWLGTVDMFLSAPSLGIYNDYAGHADLTGLPHGQWETLALQLPDADASKLSGGGYSDLTFTIALNVPNNETGHFRLDHLRPVPDVIPSLYGIATDSAGHTKAVFTYTTTATSVSISYGQANALLDANNAFIAAPPEVPPQTFVAATHAPFLATLTGAQLTWKIGSHTATATPQSSQLPTQTLGDGTRVATLPDGRKVNLDSTPPQDPTPQTDPVVGAPFNGTIPAHLSVSPSGAAVYSVPIAIPPGIAGMAPNLSLVYNSQAGDGIAGQGWDLTGLSAIQRCPKTRVQDGQARAVRMGNPATQQPTDNDTLCLDGKRIFRRPDGTYESEATDFAKITSQAQGFVGHFVVVTKSGETRFYGWHPYSTVTLQGDADADYSSGDALWALDRVEDTWGNYYDIHYNNDNTDFADRGLLVTEIDYTGHLANTGATSAASVPPFTSVTFGYETTPRPDVRLLRFANSVLPRNRRLSTVTSQLGTYTLTYLSDSDPTLPSRLGSIGFCAPSGACLNQLHFDWDGGGYDWQRVPSASIVGQDNSYELPVPLVTDENADPTKVSSGVQLVDLDGDGRLDLVESFNPHLGGTVATSLAWRNNGHGWTAMGSWALPEVVPGGSSTTLVGGDGPTGMLADIDGDGLPDLIEQTGKLCENGQCTSDIKVWFNRLKTDGQWESEADAGTHFSTLPSTGFELPDFATSYTMADMNGDGRADLVKFDAPNESLQVLLSTGTGWEQSFAYGGIPDLVDYYMADINRDGLPDMVRSPDAAPATPAFPAIYINTGVPHGFGGPLGVPLVWEVAPVGITPPPSARFSNVARFADIDGDGLYDVGFELAFGNRNVEFSTGSNYTKSILADANGHIASKGPYVDAIDQSGIPLGMYAALPDVNADGLADLVAGASVALSGSAFPNTLFVNTGVTWKPLSNSTRVPEITGALDGVTTVFIDLDGDGVVDLLSSDAANANDSPPGQSRAWLNKFRPPVIKFFPDGLAQKAQVSYASITSDAAVQQGTYIDDEPLADGTTYFMAPLRVVSSTSIDDAVGGTATTNYQYHSLRASATGRGPQGFSRIDAIDASGMDTVTTFAQAYPYTGLPTSVNRVFFTSPPFVVSSTTTKYCDRFVEAPDQCAPVTGLSGGYAAGTSLFVYPITITDTSVVNDSTQPSAQERPSASVTTTSEFRYDASGNPIRITVTTQSSGGETYKRETINTYGDGSSLNDTEVQLGKPHTAIVTTQRLTPLDGNNTAIVHSTEFDYSSPMSFSDDPAVHGIPHNTVALSIKKIEPGAGSPLELDTAYGYDRFGNVLTTTSCASAFTDCAPGAVGPPDLPFRTTKVSYDGNDFNLPSGPGLLPTLSDGQGRFPIKTTNAAGHVEYTGYDPIKGVILQRTSPNGVHTCYSHDDFGRETSETARCGSSGPLTTTIERWLTAPTFDPPPAMTITVTRPPTGAASWVYADVRGRTVASRGRSFVGGFTQTITEYDHLGRLAADSKPRLLGDALYLSVPTYDAFGRVQKVTEDLARLVSFGIPITTSISTTWTLGAGTTAQTVNGQTEQRTETKNGIGTVASVTDSSGATITYAYDADGNVSKTTDPAGNVVSVTYDVRGRKIATADPDLGTWAYVYNGYGDLVSQTDAKTQTTTMSYDTLGRLISKTDNTGTAQWVYDVAPGAGVGRLAAVVSAPDTRLNLPCTIPLVTASGGNRTGRSFMYNEFSDLASTTECIDGDSFKTSYEYDVLGRQALIRYPVVGSSQLAVGYHYTSLGFLQYLTDESSDYSVLWQANGMNALGQVTDEQMRNGVQTVSTRNPVTGALLASASTAHFDGNKLIQNWAYSYDEAGNLLTRDRSDVVNVAPSSEIFTYDTLNRLQTSRVIIPGKPDATDSFFYNTLGNLTQKSGKTFSYGGCGAGPHAVCSVASGPSLQYDANGNLFTGPSRNVIYSPANRTTHIDNGTAAAEFVYGAEGNRVVQVAGPVGSGGAASARTVYVGLGATGKSLYERTTAGGTIQHINYIYAGSAHDGNAFAVRVLANDGTPTASKYFNFDHIGSVTAVSDDSGRVPDVASAGPNAGVLGYDPWGARRSPDGQAADPATFNDPVGHREFTGQETIPNVGLVNMNGRIYDPVLGRFLSADSNVGLVADLQSYNRYSYVLNNPLRYTDHTGYFVDKYGHVDPSIIRGIGIGIAVVGIAVCPVTEGTGCGVAVAFLGAFYGAAVMVQSGAGFGEVVAVTAIGIIAGAEGGALAGALGGGGAGQLIGGAVAGAGSAVLNDLYLGRGIGGGGILTAAAFGAASAALGWIASQPTAVDEASVAEAQGAHPQGLTGTRKVDPSSWWDWAGSSTDIFNSDQSGLSDEFIKRMQPVFDRVKLNVDLAQVSFTFGGATNYTVGYDVFLAGGTLDLPFDDVLGNVLHELGHTVQTMNAPQTTLAAKIAYIDHLTGEQNWQFDRMYGDVTERYVQDPYLQRTSLNQLSRTHLLAGMYSLDSQADRFRDVLLSYSGK